MNSGEEQTKIYHQSLLNAVLTFATVCYILTQYNEYYQETVQYQKSIPLTQAEPYYKILSET
jgi:hypothetical protein